ncbi:type IV inositol polyphosphate 5-phosphatase 7-like [Silene latifolia]|uniref:type IV inositol polyphosphate 5-phosphatase 7-like n=1 Tax=Silene latifolia TaxID=37657 RepID=UPI003D7751D7
MREDAKPKKSKLSWSKSLIRKWFNIKSKREAEDYHADELAFGGEVEWRSSFSEREQSNLKKSKIEKFNIKTDGLNRGGGEYLEHPRIIDVQNHSVFVGTWNVAGKSPPSNMSLDDWLHASPAADIYVLGFQEIVPLNPSNILGSEDNGPAKKWVSLIRKTLNNRPGICGSSGNHTPSPVPTPIIEMNADFEGSSRHKAASFFHRRSFQATGSWKNENDPSSSQPRLDRRYSVCDRAIFGHRSSNYRPSDYRPSDCRPSDYRPSDYRPSDYRPSDYRPSDYRPSDFSKWGSSEEDYYPGDSPSTVLFSPMSCGGSAHSDIGYRQPKQSRYCLIVSKQMVGIYLTVWVRKDLREHVRNVKVSCVGRGLMGYLGNKGSIAVSMLLHQTSFCFVCTHLTSGQKEGDELRRNADVMEILKKTRFPRVSSTGEEKSPETIVEHDRVIWLGDLNYRLTLPYRSVRALVEMQNWRALLEKDQLRMEQRRGHVFSGWNEGNIYFPPTYKYSHNSDRYAGDDMHPKEKRRTPAWCDRILWHGSGLHQLSYVRAESRFSDHRPVYSIFWAEVESIPARLRRSMSHASAKIEVADLLPYSQGYTELCFF